MTPYYDADVAYMGVVETLIDSAEFEILDSAIAKYEPSHVFGLFSGGHDSLASTYIASKHPAFTAAVHIDTGIGIDETRQFVVRTAERERWPLLVYRPDAKTYDDLVLDKGFPSGPKSHNAMYYWLKQRQVRRLVQVHKQHTHDRIALVTGIRLQESQRRMESTISVEVRRDGASVWIQPILHWSRQALNDFIDVSFAWSEHVRGAGWTRTSATIPGYDPGPRLAPSFGVVTGIIGGPGDRPPPGLRVRGLGHRASTNMDSEEWMSSAGRGAPERVKT